MDFKNRVLSFGAIGGVGFVVDAGLLQVLFLLGVQPLAARCVSFPAAVTVTWILNRRYTFRDRPSSDGRTRYVRYIAGQVIGALINMAAFVLTIRFWPALAKQPIVPMIVGSALALVFNYSWANLLVFKPHLASR